ncbi:MAG: COX15/CtaA family protein [Cyclobacteriaceae bacterium]|nr:COX15/CtaA family protein [Cyclobacteriaceae bacterium]
MKANPNSGSFYNRLAIITLSAVYLLILAGGIVRSTGSGMGCPDWPKCFGTWVPPTSADQLPANYQVTYAEQRVRKNHRLAGYLEKLGFAGTAKALRAETIAAPEAAFNVNKTWTEYINRLIGVLVGLLIMGTMAASLKFRGTNKTLVWGSLAAFLLVVVQGWLGSVVVSTNLLPWMITVHMVLAVVILCLLIYLVHESTSNTWGDSLSLAQIKPLRAILVISLTAMVIQIAMGTQVREAIDLIAVQFGFAFRDQWIENLGTDFYIHRSFSLLILGINVYLYLLLRRTKQEHLIWWAQVLLALLLVEIVVGALMVYFAIPAWAQPIHLLTSTLIIGLQFWLFLEIKRPQTV